MTASDVFKLLEANKNPRGIANWDRVGIKGLSSFGIGVTQLRRIARKVGRDHDLAGELWKSGNYDAMIVSMLIEDPDKVTRAQVTRQMRHLDFWMFSYLYADSVLGKVPFARELMAEWLTSRKDLERRMAWSLLGGIAKKDEGLPDGYFEPYLSQIEKKIRKEENFVRDAMNNSLLYIGQRSRSLNQLALAVAKKIGKVTVDYGDNSCQAVDCVKHLSGPTVRKKLGKG